MTDATRPRIAARRRWSALLLGASIALIAANLAVPVGTVAGELTYNLVSCGAAVVAWAGALRSGNENRRVARAIALGVTLSAVGDVIWSVWSLTQPTVPDVLVADVAWLSAYVAIVAGLFMMLGRGKRWPDVDGLIDIAAVLALALLVQWELVIAGTVTDGSLPVGVRLVWSLYPALDAVLLALVARLVFDRSGGSPSARLVALGAGLWLVSDFGYLLTDGSAARWLNAGWLLGAVFLATSTWRPMDRAPRSQGERVGLGRIAVALLPLLAPGTIQLVTHLRGAAPEPLPMLTATGVMVGIAFLRMGRLLRAEQRARRALNAEKRYASAIAANSSDAVAVVDRRGLLLDDAPNLVWLLGRGSMVTTGRDVVDLLGPCDVELFRSAFERVLRVPGEVHEVELEARHGADRSVWLGVRMVNRLEDPDVRGIVMNLHDVSARKDAEEALTRQAFHDSLTGIPNRLLFLDRLDHALRRCERSRGRPVVVYLDLDGFKQVNDTRGHLAGDEVLREVARRVTSVVRPEDTVARMGGDEFAVLVDDCARPTEEGSAVAERIIRSLRAPSSPDHLNLPTTASIGIAVGQPDDTAISVLRDADVAMYEAKTSGKSRWVVYDRSFGEAARARLELETDLIGALEAGQFRLVYQPVVDLNTERVVGFEALLRWDHPRRGLIPPDEFIPIAEQSGVIVPIGRWVLETACEVAASWHAHFASVDPPSIAVNVSARQLADGDFARHVTEALARSGLRSSSLVLEMTETALIEDPETASERLQELRRLGLRLAIDDFGTGYSSLSYLRQFPIDILKIDRSFTAAISDESGTPAIVRGLLDLSRTLGLRAIAEGIETAEQLTALRQVGCELGQGYLFTAPLPPEEIELMLLDQRRLRTELP